VTAATDLPLTKYPVRKKTDLWPLVGGASLSKFYMRLCGRQSALASDLIRIHRQEM
jgi:hypothetical protein